MMGIHTKIPKPRAQAPQVTPDTVAMIVRGYCMGAIRDGWYVLIEDNQSPPHDGIIDQLCIVQLRDGRSMLRFVKKGRKPNRWDLVPVSGDPILDAEVDWAEVVQWIRPHKPTESELEFLATLNSHGEYLGRRG